MNSSSSNKKLSFFLPFYNEADQLENTIRKIILVADNYLSDYEVLLINDGSTDRSLEIAAQLIINHKNTRLISFDKNEGFGKAFIAGLLNAKHNHALYLSADGDVNEHELQMILGAWDGLRPVLQFAKNPADRHFLRFLLSKIFTFLVNTLTKNNWPYYNGFNIYNLKNKNRLAEINFGFATQAYALLTLFDPNDDIILLKTTSEFNDSTSKAITLNNFNKAFLFFYFIMKNRI